MSKKDNTISFKAPSEKDKKDLKKDLKKLNKGKGTFSDYEIMRAGILAKSPKAEKIIEENPDGTKSTYLRYSEAQLHYRKTEAVNKRDLLLLEILKLNDEIVKYNQLLNTYDIEIENDKDVIDIFDKDGNKIELIPK